MFKLPSKFTSNHALFLTGLLIKLCLGGLFASTFLTGYFIPFVSYFTEHHLASPYLHFTQIGFPEAFPYPALMLYILAIPKLVLGWLPVSDMFLMRLPLLVADITIFMTLYHWLGGKSRKLIWYYWFSPVLFYVSYLHGQLDVIPIALLFLSLRFLFSSSMALNA